jgi:hypothetical protein
LDTAIRLRRACKPVDQLLHERKVLRAAKRSMEAALAGISETMQERNSRERRADLQRGIVQVTNGGWHASATGMSHALFAALKAEGKSDDEAWQCRSISVVEQELRDREQAIAEADERIAQALAAWERAMDGAQA